ncbi:DUF1427 family protein [Ruegeria sp. R14_0]|uniref:DUF1427 family protein n=1 Tax=Ruegeria sp. R14_0 TaxID=2821100 RepID=UPI001ADAA786|nr:DUF1427 family protein [Ruegeria sp. R14_0]MBO9447569.1 DUF1427 family protein [Ruegeria sp. R14_0]
MDWKAYVFSLSVGVLVGVIYALLNTRSPAPPIIALLGLLGMLIGESLAGWAKKQLTIEEAAAECLHTKSFAQEQPEAAQPAKGDVA